MKKQISKFLPHGSLKAFSELTGIPVSHVSGYLSGKRTMSKARSLLIEKASKKLGYDFKAEDWMFNPEKIKQVLIDQGAVEAA